MIALLVAAVNLFGQTFAGTWTCHTSIPATSDHPARSFSTDWDIQAAPGDHWTVVHWGSQVGENGGVAYVGYVPTQNDWAYQDFHYDGSYAVSTSAGPDKDGVWTWAGGAYYTENGIQHGVVTWKLASSTRIERSFTRVVDGKSDPPVSDYCSKR
ncbi:MAG TPA: hypothetical protein VKT72_13205 [Candidatus Baltobacteraceae bacterium]|nr:hypothetical protein [Candidatus Baltobacteraceae bacterium]